MKRKVLVAGRVSVGLLASGGLGWLAIRGLDWGEVGDHLSGVSPSLLLVAIAVFMLASYLRAVRLRILFATDDLTSTRLFVIQNEGIGLNNVLPVRVAGEAMQLAILTLRDGVKGATALATLGMERVIDVVASTLILTVAFFMVEEMKQFAPYVLGTIVFTVLAVALVRVLSWGSEALAVVRRIPFLSAFALAVRDLERERSRLAMSFAVTVVYWLIVGITAWIIAVAIDLPMSPVTATLVIIGTIFFATAVPAAPSAVGTFEWAVIYVLEFFDIDRSAGFGYAVVIHAVFFLPPTIIAAVFLPREGILTMRGLRRRATPQAGTASSL